MPGEMPPGPSASDNREAGDHVWGRVEIPVDRRGIDTLKLERLVAAVPDWTGVSCLEVGCGAGRYLRALDRLFSRQAASFAGADISEASLEAAKRLSDGIDYRTMTTDRIPWEDGAFDVVCFLDVLEHVDDPDAFVAESLRVVKPGGVLHGSIPLEGDTRSLWRWLDVIRLHDRVKIPLGHIQRFDVESVERMIAPLPVAVEQRTYSYHLLGNLFDVGLFTALGVARAFGARRDHYDLMRVSRGWGGPLGWAVSAADWAMYSESTALADRRGMNLHLTLRKRARGEAEPAGLAGGHEPA